QRIEKAVLAAARERPEVQPFFNRAESSYWKPFFVKSVEQVQGDERDVIILAVGYGRRSGTGVAHTFGPLTQDGGERRLNVAITRARRQMHVVSSFTAADLDPARLKKRGAELLRAFLDYAERGPAALGEGPSVVAPTLTPYEQDVANRLRAAGLDPHPQYGVAGYRIDFVLPHPEQ